MFRFFAVFLFVAGMIVLPSCGRADSVVADSKISAVTVYTNRAMVTRTAVVDVKAGNHEVVFEGLPSALFTDSLRVEGCSVGKVVFGALSHRLVTGSELRVPLEKELNGRLEDLQSKKRLVKAEKQALESRRKFLESIGKQASVRVDEEFSQMSFRPEKWASAAKAISDGMGEVLKADVLLDAKIREIDLEIQKIRTELNQMRTGQRNTYRVTIPVEVAKDTKLDVELSYQVPNAGWRPIYDARLDTADVRLSLVQYGSVRQTTGEDWKDVKLVLSTARPHRGASLPRLRPMWVNVWKSGERAVRAVPLAVQKRKVMKDSVMADNFAGAGELMGVEMLEMQAPEPISAEFASAEVETGGFVSEYKVAGNASVLSNGMETKLMVGSFDMESKLQIHVKPQVSTDAFLVADAKLKGDSPVLPGKVSLFRDNTYVGQTAIPLLRPDEDYEFFFGIDDQLSVDRKVVEDKKNDAKVVIRDNVLERHFVTRLQNLHTYPADVVVKEVIPSEKNDKIKVSIVEKVTTKGYEEDADDVKGLLRWQFAMPPKSEKKVELGWKVSWPRDYEISGIR